MCIHLHICYIPTNCTILVLCSWGELNAVGCCSLFACACVICMSSGYDLFDGGHHSFHI